MAIIDQLRDLNSRIQGELARGSDYYIRAGAAWRLVQRRVAEGQTIRVINVDTGSAVGGPDLADLAQEYVRGYLAESVFQHYVSIFEDYIFGLINLWLLAFPKGIIGLADDKGDDRLRQTGKEVPLSLIIDSPDRESILRAVIERELDRLKYRRLAAWFDYLE